MSTDQTNSTAGLEVLLSVDGPGPVTARLGKALRSAVRDGRLVGGAALPPSRTLAQTLGVSRWVVTEVYGELVAEGVLEARTGSGTRVAATRPGRAVRTTPRAREGERSESTRRGESAEPSRRGESAEPSRGGESAEPSRGGESADGFARAEFAGDRLVGAESGRALYDLGPGVPELRHLPRAAWVRAVRAATMHATADKLLSVAPRGAATLREALAERLAVSRAVVADADDVVVTHGSGDGIGRLTRVLAADGHRALLVEDPSWPRLRDVAAAAGLVPVPVPVDGDGLNTDALVRAARETGARAVLVTPAHQFPRGVLLAPDRRDALVRWAHDVDGLVIEDDYDAEFRYDRRPVAALQGLAPHRVVLLGSVSKTLAAGFGLGWLVGPAELTARPDALLMPPPATVHQLAFAAMLADGAYDRHLRAMRGRYRRRRAALLDALGERLPGLPLSGIAAGLHAVLTLPVGVIEARVVEAAARRDVHVVGMERYRVLAGTRAAALVLGYGNLADARLPEAVERLAAAVRDTSAP